MSEAQQPPPRLRRTWPQRLLITVNLLVVVAALTSAVAIGYLNQSVGDIPRVRLGDVLRSPEGTATGRAQNYLIVGVDSAAGLDPGDPVLNGRTPSLNSDTIMVLRIDPQRTSAQLLSFPRDLWVDIAGTNRKNKINSAIEYTDPSDPQAGQKRLIQTIQQNFQVSIDHYLQIDFAGFRKIVRTVGGVPVYFDTPVRDRHLGLSIPDPGCVTLDQTSALNYARSRYYEIFRDGVWQPDPSSDLGRISRQQDFIKRVVKRAIAKGVRNPVKLRSMLDAGKGAVTLDETLTIGQLADLGLRFRQFNPDNLKTYSLPVVFADHGRAQAVDLVPEAAEPILRMFQGLGRAELAPSTVNVSVRNGSGRENEASLVSLALFGAGFRTGPPGDAAGTSTTMVRYPPGRLAAAQLVARYVASPVRFVETTEVTEVQLVTGADFTTILRTPKPASQVPTSVAPPTTAGLGEFAPPSTTTTTSTPGFVPPAPPPNVSCG